MPTFVLKKYQEEADNGNRASTAEETSTQENDKKEELTISVVGPVSEIVANALYKIFSTKATIEVKKDESSSEQESEEIKTISTEDINKDPLSAFNMINKGDVVFIDTGKRCFSTTQEEWFLTNICNKTNNVFYTVESLIKYIEERLWQRK
jgi:hypothetical protein